MLGTEEAVKKINDDGLNTVLPSNPDRIAHRVHVKRSFGAAVVAQSYRHFGRSHCRAMAEIADFARLRGDLDERFGNALYDSE